MRIIHLGTELSSLFTLFDVNGDGAIQAANRCLSYLSDVDLIYVSFTSTH